MFSIHRLPLSHLVTSRGAGGGLWAPGTAAPAAQGFRGLAIAIR